MRRAALALAALCFSTIAAFAGTSSMDAAVTAHGFSGAVLVVDRGHILFDKAYGQNRTTTAFRSPMLARLYIASAILALIDKHKIALDNTAEQFADGAGPITIGDLLRRSDDAGVLIQSRVLAGAVHDSLSGALDSLIFSSLWMTASGIDTDDTPRNTARDRGLPPPRVAKSTTRDVLRWIHAVLGGDLVSPEGRKMLLETWQKVPQMPGDDAWEATSAEAAIIVQPGIDRTVIVLGNDGTTSAATLAAQLYGGLPKD